MNEENERKKEANLKDASVIDLMMRKERKKKIIEDCFLRCSKHFMTSS
jgi:hypothetical protein